MKVSRQGVLTLKILALKGVRDLASQINNKTIEFIVSTRENKRVNFSVNSYDHL